MNVWKNYVPRYNLREIRLGMFVYYLLLNTSYVKGRYICDFVEMRFAWLLVAC